MSKQRDMSVQLNLRAGFTHLSSLLYYMANAYDITDDDILASALLLMHNDMSANAKVIQGMIEDLSE